MWWNVLGWLSLALGFTVFGLQCWLLTERKIEPFGWHYLVLIVLGAALFFTGFTTIL